MCHSGSRVQQLFFRQKQGKARIQEEPKEGAQASELQLLPHAGERRDWTPNHTEPASNSLHHG